jgi:hypothetical protein
MQRGVIKDLDCGQLRNKNTRANGRCKQSENEKQREQTAAQARQTGWKAEEKQMMHRSSTTGSRAL